MKHDIERAIAGQQVGAPVASTQAMGGTAVGALAGLGGGLGDTQTRGQHTAVAPSDDEPPEDQSRKWWAYAILAVLLLGALAFGIYKLTQPDDVRQIVVPDVVGQDVETATRALENKDFQVTTQEKTDADVAKGDVISQDPEGNSKQDKGSEVTLVVSSGPDQVTIPQLQGFQYGEAKALLESDKYGLVVKKTEQDSSAPQNEVINSNPPGGTPVDKGSTVTLLVSKGSATVPNVVGMSEDEAKSTLRDAGFKVSVHEDSTAAAPQGQVTAQSVPQGQERPRGSTVEITVSTGEGDGGGDGGLIDGGGTESP
jgi:serine/threonine-protein kinase